MQLNPHSHTWFQSRFGLHHHHWTFHWPTLCAFCQFSPCFFYVFLHREKKKTCDWWKHNELYGKEVKLHNCACGRFVCVCVCHLYSVFTYYYQMSLCTGEGTVQTRAERGEEKRDGTIEGGVGEYWDMLGQQYHPTWVIGHTVSSHPTSHTDSLRWRRGDDNSSHDQGGRKRHISVRGCSQQLLYGGGTPLYPYTYTAGKIFGAGLSPFLPLIKCTHLSWRPSSQRKEAASVVSAKNNMSLGSSDKALF